LFVERSNLRLLRFARNGEKCRRIASLRSQRRKMPPDCFASLAVIFHLSLRGRILVSEAVSTVRSHCEPRFFVWRSNLLSHPVGIRDCFAPLAETTKRRSNLAFPLPWETARPLRRFAPRGDKVWVSLRGRRFALFFVSARSSFRFRSSLAFCPDRRVSLRASFVRLAKQSQRFLAASRLRKDR
jgi:hypothetical protein